MCSFANWKCQECLIDTWSSNILGQLTDLNCAVLLFRTDVFVDCSETELINMLERQILSKGFTILWRFWAKRGNHYTVLFGNILTSSKKHIPFSCTPVDFSRNLQSSSLGLFRVFPREQAAGQCRHHADDQDQPTQFLHQDELLPVE